MKTTIYKCDSPQHSVNREQQQGQVAFFGYQVDGSTHRTIVEQHSCNSPVHLGEVLMDVLYNDNVSYVKVVDISTTDMSKQ